MVERFEHSVEAGASAAAEVLALDPGITALVATSDVLALGAIDELTRRRQRVPEDVSVTGFDGIRAALDAELTTVVQPVVEKGRQAGRLLLDPARRPQGGGSRWRPRSSRARPRPESDLARINISRRGSTSPGADQSRPEWRS